MTGPGPDDRDSALRRQRFEAKHPEVVITPPRPGRLLWAARAGGRLLAAAYWLGGLTLGGGIGYLSRQLGLTIDSLTGVELVTAAGVASGTSGK